MAHYALDHGYHTIIEGIFHAAHCASMLTALREDHRGGPALLPRLCRLAKGSGCPGTATIACVEMRAFDTADQAAGSAVAMIEDGERLSSLWRYVFVQLLDDYTSVLHHQGVQAAAQMWASSPRTTGDVRVDAAFAAMAEYLARRDGWAVPSWARLPEREAWPWWFVTELRGLHPRALVESPSSFRRRGVFITSGALDRA